MFLKDVDVWLALIEVKDEAHTPCRVRIWMSKQRSIIDDLVLVHPQDL